MPDNAVNWHVMEAEPVAGSESTSDDMSQNVYVQLPEVLEFSVQLLL